MRIIMREDGQFVDAEAREEITPLQLLNFVRSGEKIRIESEKTGEEVTGEALVEAIRRADPAGDFVDWLNSSFRNIKTSVSSQSNELEESVKNWFRKITTGYGPDEVEEWYVESSGQPEDGVETRIMQLVRSALLKLGVPDSEKIEELEERVTDLEEKLNS
ncbi:MAG: hypothetical protein ACLFN5_01415 [bacterium]